MSGPPGFGATWWGRAWIDALEQRAELDPNRLPRGRTYARQDRVLSISADPGEVTALVAGSRATPYRVRLRVRMFSDDEWERVLDGITARTAHAAALLDGDLLPEIVDDLHDVGIGLLPGPGELGPQCSCPDWADPCKHAAAVCYLVALMLDRDPFELFHLRGRERDQLLAEVRARRAGAPAGGDAGLDGAPGEEAFGARRPRRTSAATFVSALEAYARVPTTIEDLRRLDVRLDPDGRGSGRAAHPPPLPVAPPSASGVRVSELQALAAAATTQAQALLIGDVDRVAGDPTEDLARLAADRLGTSEIAALASRAQMSVRQVELLGAAWAAGGREALAVTDGRSSEPPPPWALDEARAALSDALADGDGRAPSMRVQGERVTAGTVQLRWAPSGRWYRFDKYAGRWEIAGAPAEDPTELC